MNNKNFFDKFSQSPLGTGIAIGVMLLTWAVAAALIIFAVFFFSLERSSRAAEAPPGTIPAITLEPASGPVGTEVNVQGQGWPANSTVLVYLTTPDQPQLPSYAVASVVVGAQGEFTASFVFPNEARWENQSKAMVVARAENTNLTAQANFDLVKLPAQPTGVLTTPVEPTSTPTFTPTPTSTPVLTPTPTLELQTPSPTPHLSLSAVAK